MAPGYLEKRRSASFFRNDASAWGAFVDVIRSWLYSITIKDLLTMYFIIVKRSFFMPSGLIFPENDSETIRSNTVVTYPDTGYDLLRFGPFGALLERYEKQSYALPWQIKSTLIILVFLPVRARSAAFCRTLRRALCRHILSKIIGRNGKSWQNEANRGRQK